MIPMRTAQGYVLLLVLVFFQLLTGLSLQAYQTILNRIKLSNANLRSTQQEYRYTRIQQTLEASLHFEEIHCVISPISFYQLARKPLNWWQTTACAFSRKEMIYYIVERLGEDACAVFANIDHSYANYYRLTILFDHLLLRSTIALPTRGTQQCQHALRQIVSGVQVHQKKISRIAGKAC